MKISFHGAAGDVTGSCHLVEAAGRRILIDCGMFQGSRELHQENAEPFGFDPTAIDFLLLTHAHLDHCGRIPLLAKRGFRGEVVTTAASRDLARLVILDSAHLQEEESQRRGRTSSRRGSDGDTEPLYSTVDALGSLDYFGRTAVYGETLEIAPGLRATFHDAGHILGSASILLEAEESGRRRSVVLSGDIGNAGRPLLRAPEPPAAADAVVMETTYGDRLHRPLDASVNELFQAITEAFGRGGNVIVPTFALERAQEILFYLRQGIETSRLPASMQVFLDSPMAISATEIFRRHPEACKPELLRDGKDPLALPGLHMVRETAQSMAINHISGGAVIMAGNGMATGGRVRHHLKHNLWRRESSVVFVGFAAKGTLAREIIDGARQVEVLGEEIPVRAHIHTINGFSAHADQAELLAWRAAIKGAETTFLVHGEGPTMETFARKLPPGRIEIPQLHQQFEL
ncbi:MAG TPA: MBL fold metallo-hydrolase [Stellaceae bacterium]|nr:MBL fold metallo-hydrolase [Stellaceae bacterium]